MPRKKVPAPTSANRLLAALPKSEYERLLSDSKEIDLIFGDTLYESHAPIRFAYFPISGVVSLLASTEHQNELEVGLVGNEGMVGLPLSVGVTTSNNRALVQGAGRAMILKASVLRREYKQDSSLACILHVYANTVLTQVSQIAACNRFHQSGARLARWLLMTHDRMGVDEFQLTQEFLSKMLGVRRERINASAVDLQKQGLITYNRGILTVLRRARLEEIACSCYGMIKDDYERTIVE
jgi:CRP-like cAMP-binding protein